MGNSLRIARVAGISIYLHWTTLLFFAWIAISDLANRSTSFAFRGLLYAVTVFTIIVLHELGHALMARRFGISTKEITLFPIGGVARLKKIPEEPLQELLIALAGPAVNCALSVSFGLLILVIRGPQGLLFSLVEADWLSFALWVNVGMGTFNLLPAFPMDGGRVLRALLATRIDYVRATEIAARTGQFLAVILALVGFYFNGMLMLIALFIYIGAQQEAVFAQMHSMLNNVPACAAMRTHFITLTSDTPLSLAFDETIANSQRDFPVLDVDQSLCGMVYHADLLNALNREPTLRMVADVMQTQYPTVPAGEMLDQVLEKMNDQNCTTMPVVSRGHILGLISLENIGEWMMIHSRDQRTLASSIASSRISGRQKRRGSVSSTLAGSATNNGADSIAGQAMR